VDDVVMPNERDFAQDVKRLNYWTRETEYVPPKKVVKHPSEVTAEDLLAFDLKAYVDHANRQQRHN